MKKLILISVILCIGASFAVAQSNSDNIGSQWDIYLHVPYYIGIHTDNDDLGSSLDYAFLVPEVNWHYYFGSDILHLGIGADLFTLILESMAMPSVAVESFMGPLVLNARVSGGAFLFFGLVNDFTTESLFFPEASVAYRFGEKKTFGVGTSIKLMIAPDVADIDNFAYIGTIYARWTL